MVWRIDPQFCHSSGCSFPMTDSNRPHEFELYVVTNWVWVLPTRVRFEVSSPKSSSVISGMSWFHRHGLLVSSSWFQDVFFVIFFCIQFCWSRMIRTFDWFELAEPNLLIVLVLGWFPAWFHRPGFKMFFSSVVPALAKVLPTQCVYVDWVYVVPQALRYVPWLPYLVATGSMWAPEIS